MNQLRDRVVKEFVHIVQIDSLSLHEEAMFAYLKERFSKLPVEVEFFEYTLKELGAKSGNLFVKIPATAKNKRPLFFDAHVDTVEPGIGVKPIVEGNIVKSDGSTILGSDDKAGVAGMIIAVEELVKSNIPHGELLFIFTSAEEIGLTGVQQLDFSKIKADFGFILDSHGKIGGVAVAAPTHYHYDIIVTGKASHAGIAPDQGVNAIKIAAEIIRSLPQGKINKNTVANVGLIEGGKATNIIADECVIRGEFRSHDNEDVKLMKMKIEAAVDRQRTKAIDIRLEFTEMYKGFNYDKTSPILLLVNAAIKKLGIKPRFERTGGGSNTNIYNQNHIAALTLAVGMTEVHSTQEYVETDDLENLVRLILSIVETA